MRGKGGGGGGPGQFESHRLRFFSRWATSPRSISRGDSDRKRRREKYTGGRGLCQNAAETSNRGGERERVGRNVFETSSNLRRASCGKNVPFPESERICFTLDTALKSCSLRVKKSNPAPFQFFPSYSNPPGSEGWAHNFPGLPPCIPSILTQKQHFPYPTTPFCFLRRIT